MICRWRCQLVYVKQGGQDWGYLAPALQQVRLIGVFVPRGLERNYDRPVGGVSDSFRDGQFLAPHANNNNNNKSVSPYIYEI